MPTTNNETGLIDKQIANVEREREKVQRKITQLIKRIESLREDGDAADRKFFRLMNRRNLIGLLGQQVKLIPGAAKSDNKLFGAVGTLVKLAVKKAVIDFGTLGIWHVPMGLVTSASTDGIDGGFVLEI